MEDKDSGSNASVSNAGQLEKLPFELQKGEEITSELKPQFRGFMITRALSSYVVLFFLTIVVIIVGILINKLSQGIFLIMAVIPALLLIVSVVPYIEYGKAWYWITTRRVIDKRGFIGYTVDSIPLENVTNIILSRTLLDRLLGISSLVIVPMSGDPIPKNGIRKWGSQSPNYFPALPQKLARELQRVLLNLKSELSVGRGMPLPYESLSSSSEAAQPKSNQDRKL